MIKWYVELLNYIENIKYINARKEKNYGKNIFLPEYSILGIPF